MREYGMDRLTRLKRYLGDIGIEATGGDADHGAFLAMRFKDARGIAKELSQRGVIADARGEWLRFCPDCLTLDDELRAGAAALHEIVG